MTDLWVDLAPLVAAMMISPARTMAMLLLLHSPSSTRTALSYVLGMVLSMMSQGVVVAIVLNAVGLTAADRANDLSILIGAFFLIGGIFLLSTSVRMFLRRGEDATGLSSRFAKMEKLNPSQGLKLGLAWLLVSPKQWVFVATAVALIYQAAFGSLESLFLWLLLTATIQLVYLVIVLSHVLMGRRAATVLDDLFEWLNERLVPLAIGIFGVLGVLLVANGLGTLSG